MSKANFSSLSFTGKIKCLWDKLYTLRCICCFTSILATVGFFMFISENTFMQYLSLFLLPVGFFSGILACGHKLMKCAGVLIVGCFLIGLFFAIVGSLIGAMFGLAFAVVLVFFFPAFVTIPYFFKELIHG